MTTKELVLKRIKKYGICKDIYCSDCPFNNKIKKGCNLGNTLMKLGAEVMLSRLKEGN